MTTRHFTIIEHATHYTIRLNRNGMEKPMGDGTDTDWYDEHGNILDVGTPEFLAAWETSLNDYPDDIMEAYFPDQTYLTQEAQEEADANRGD